MNQGFKDLNVWKKCRELRQYISVLAKGLPDVEKYRLKDHMIRASRSVTANIAEGYGRYHFKESIQYTRQSPGSLTELADHKTVSLDEEYIDLEELNKFEAQITECLKLVNGYINYLKKLKTDS